MTPEARAAYKAAWYQKNKERSSAAQKARHDKNPEVKRRYHADYYEKNRDKIRTYRSDWQKANRRRINEKLSARRQTDVCFRLAGSLRNRLGIAVRRGYKSGSAVAALGISMEDFQFYLELLFQPGMSWENYGQWHIDHIRPLTSFDLEDTQQLAQACHYTNMQPLWAGDNQSKGAKWAP